MLSYLSMPTQHPFDRPPTEAAFELLTPQEHPDKLRQQEQQEKPEQQQQQQPQEPEPQPQAELISLDSDGDLILVVRDPSKSTTRHFLTSSSKLAQASRVFCTMLGPNFSEGQRLRSEPNKDEPATVTLDEDDVDAMDFILSVIHTDTSRIMTVTLTARDIVAIALQVDKYDCAHALLPWINAWCNPNCFPIDKKEKTRDMGYALLAAYLFRSPNFERISAFYVKDLPPDFVDTWAKEEVLGRLPETVWEGLLTQVNTTLRSLRLLVLRVAEDLRRERHMKRCQNTNCVVCSSPNSPNSPAASEPLLQSRCPRGMSEYLGVLQGVDIWPSLLPFETLSVNNVVELIETLPKQVAHRCSDGTHCRLKCGVEELCAKVKGERDSMKGVPLPPLEG